MKEIEVEGSEPELIPETQEQINAYGAELHTRVWYHRCYQSVLEGVSEGWEEMPPEEIREGMFHCAAQAEKDYPDLALEVVSDRELGRLEGQLYALRWIAGEEGLGMDT